jgi:hypothetical protein
MPCRPYQGSRKRFPKPDRRRALEILASCRDGCTEALMLAHRFTIPRKSGAGGMSKKERQAEMGLAHTL